MTGVQLIDMFYLKKKDKIIQFTATLIEFEIKSILLRQQKVLCLKLRRYP